MKKHGVKAFYAMNRFHILLRIGAIIFLVEGMIMFVMSRIPPHSLQISAFIDSAILVLVSSPFIFIFAIRPYVNAQTRDLVKAKKMAETANHAKDDFLAHMSHELRTPLNAVIGFAQLLQHLPAQPLSETQTDYTNSIIFSGEHLLEIINGMLDLAAIEADQVHLTLEDVLATEVINDCITLMRPSAQKRDVNLVNNFLHLPTVRIHTDVLRLKQTLLNLLSNAIKYNVPDGTVTMAGDVLDDGFLRLSVVDTGRGIAPEHFDNIFQPFDRLGIETTRTIEGTGIGLTVTKKLIQLMGARIGLKSQLGTGSTFWIDLPMAAQREEIAWDKELKIGIDRIDADHKFLISLLNKIGDHSLNTTQIETILEELLTYTRIHFEREEAILAACDYAHLTEHQSAHQHLTTQTQRLAHAWHQKNDPDLIVELLNFLRTWLVNHIMEENKEIAMCTQGREADIVCALDALDANERRI